MVTPVTFTTRAPVQDLARARKFYETTLGGTFQAETMGPMEMVIFPYTSG